MKVRYLSDMAKIIQGFTGEEMDGANLTEHSPAGTVGSEDQILIVVSNILGTRIGRAVREISIMNFQELSGDGGGGGDYNVDEAHSEMHERAVGFSKRGHGVVRDWA